MGGTRHAGAGEGRAEQLNRLVRWRRALLDRAEVQFGLGGLNGSLGECRRGGVGDVADVSAGESGQRLAGTLGGGKVVAGQPGPQLADRAKAGVHVGVGHRGLQVGRDGRRGDADAPPPAAGQVQFALQIDLAAWGLVRVLLADLAEDIVIQLIKRHPAVFVLVGVPGG